MMAATCNTATPRKTREKSEKNAFKPLLKRRIGKRNPFNNQILDIIIRQVIVKGKRTACESLACKAVRQN